MGPPFKKYAEASTSICSCYKYRYNIIFFFFGSLCRLGATSYILDLCTRDGEKGEYIKNLQVIEDGSKRVRVPTVTKRLTEGYRNDCSIHPPKKRRRRKKKGYSQKKVTLVHLCLQDSSHLILVLLRHINHLCFRINCKFYVRWPIISNT